MPSGYSDKIFHSCNVAGCDIQDAFSIFSRSLELEIKKINEQEEKWSFLGVSYASIERYRIVNDYLVRHYQELTDLKILDLGCFVGFYVLYLHGIGVSDAFGMDISKESIEYGRNVLGISNLLVEDIASSSDDSFSLGSFDSILCIHIFEYMVIQKNGADFIEKVLRNVFGLLKDGGIFFFNIGEGYKKFDIETGTYIHFDGKVDFKKEDCLNLGFSKIEELEGNYFVLTK